MGNSSGTHVITIRNGHIQDRSEDDIPETWKKFVVIQTGKTNGAHKPVVKKLKSKGQKEVKSPEEADYCLVFCPVSSRVGTDVSDAMEQLPEGKKAVLVVMHHTFNSKQVIPRSSRLVDKQRVPLTVDFLFHKKKLLNCKYNDKNMMSMMMKFYRFKKSCGFNCLAPAPMDDNEVYQRNSTNRRSAQGQKKE